MSNMDGFYESKEKAFADDDTGVFTGVRCPDCEAYMERDSTWLYCLECGYEEENESN